LHNITFADLRWSETGVITVCYKLIANILIMNLNQVTSISTWIPQFFLAILWII